VDEGTLNPRLALGAKEDKGEQVDAPDNDECGGIANVQGKPVGKG
jgi:hypothetical protein